MKITNSYHLTGNQYHSDYQSKKFNFQEMDTYKYMCTYTGVYLHLFKYL